ncbi:hypothetical protein JVX92_00700 [Microbacterium hominis]|uniref:hypothetical protein n=1 Tax=Microbacterium hominis TaxID=162426 RepID=UPI0019645278|nr:hypothetical protein [Microbacterium hominis]QRY40847.1 hypothetical protein JVX92_00700 [Microbacterium hominis]
MFDFNSLTGREISVIEELSGVSITRLSDDEAPKGKFLSAIYFIAKRREEPTLKFNDALDTRMDAMNSYLGFDADEEDDEQGKSAASATSEPA